MNNRVVLVLARILIASVFVGLGADRLIGGTAAGGTIAFSVFELVAGLAIMIGWQVRWIALLMAAFLTVDALLSHPFWNFPGVERHGQLLHFLKNISAIGGLVLLSRVEAVRQSGEKF